MFWDHGNHVEFTKNSALELLDQVDGTEQTGNSEPFFEFAGKIIHQADILLDNPIDAGADDFDGHLISGTAWSSTDLDARPYDIDNDPAGIVPRPDPKSEISGGGVASGAEL